jgi:hypothetical protein
MVGSGSAGVAPNASAAFLRVGTILYGSLEVQAPIGGGEQQAV